MSNSLQHRLFFALSMAIVGVGLLASLASFWLAMGEAQEYQDASLRQIAALIPQESRHSPTQTVAPPTDEDPDARILVQALSGTANAHTPVLRLPMALTPGFHTVPVDGQNWRVFVRSLGPGEKIAVAQSTDVRSDAALDSALRTLIPLLLLVPILLLIARYLIQRSLTPVHTLATAADAQRAESPEPLPIHGVPGEIVPFLRAINRLLERVREMMKHQRRFVADAAHELRTPLTALSLQVQNLERAATLAECKERLVPLQNGLARAQQLLEQLLGLARQQAAGPARNPVNLGQVARLVTENLIPLAEQKQQDFGLELHGEVWVEGSEEALYSLVRNAVDNALRYSPAHGEITLRLRQEDTSAVVEIMDSGPGIPPAALERVFDPFYRLPDSPAGGSGLGLTIARQIAEQLGGEITLSPRKDRQGLVFSYRQALARKQ
ncbi:MAG: HAMP domain-containing histidine kinase [Acidithiobacillus sp.]|nr:HAMP domain-containing histidine kinase [Acidithiobacillus sp.]